MTSLREHASALAGEQQPAQPPQDAAYEPAAPAQQFDPMADYEPGEGDPEMVPVHIAWLRVRREIRAIGKRELYNQAGTRFNFRGVDTVVKHFGPVTLKHGVHVLPVKVDTEYGEKHTKNGARMRECTAVVTWHVMGPMGDVLTLQTAGEALDMADKSTPKAQSVALRTLLLTFGLTPTDEPDPDSSYIERGEAPLRPLTDYRDEIVDPNTSIPRLRTIRAELREQRRLTSVLPNEHGDDEQMGAMIDRIGTERSALGGAE
jgi:hypothetical protein